MSAIQEKQRDWLTLGEVCRILDISSNTVRNLVIRGQLFRADVPGNRRYRRADVERLNAPKSAS